MSRLYSKLANLEKDLIIAKNNLGKAKMAQEIAKWQNTVESIEDSIYDIEDQIEDENTTSKYDVDNDY